MTYSKVLLDYVMVQTREIMDRCLKGIEQSQEIANKYDDIPYDRPYVQIGALEESIRTIAARLKILADSIEREKSK